LQISVFIVSDVRVHREGLAALLRDCPSIKVMGAHNLRDSQHALHSAAVDVALIDGALPIESDTIGALRKTCAPVRILAVGIRETATDVLACAAAGIDGYAPMDGALGDMVTAIENAVRGELACSPKVAASLYQCIGNSSAVIGNPLTARELQVAELVNRVTQGRGRIAERRLKRAKSGARSDPAIHLLARRQKGRDLLQIGKPSAHPVWANLHIRHRCGTQKFSRSKPAPRRAPGT
jgi:DNA-binding NarL/FixJ family response regulator